MKIILHNSSEEVINLYLNKLYLINNYLSSRGTSFYLLLNEKIKYSIENNNIETIKFLEKNKNKNNEIHLYERINNMKIGNMYTLDLLNYSKFILDKSIDEINFNENVNFLSKNNKYYYNLKNILLVKNSSEKDNNLLIFDCIWLNIISEGKRENTIRLFSDELSIINIDFYILNRMSRERDCSSRKCILSENNNCPWHDWSYLHINNILRIMNEKNKNNFNIIIEMGIITCGIYTCNLKINNEKLYLIIMTDGSLIFFNNNKFYIFKKITVQIELENIFINKNFIFYNFENFNNLSALLKSLSIDWGFNNFFFTKTTLEF